MKYEKLSILPVGGKNKAFERILPQKPYLSMLTEFYVDFVDEI
ncbi:MAG: hypothetical protein ACP5N0_13185 [Methanosarcina sp.]